jgi:hypothetical protein
MQGGAGDMVHLNIPAEVVPEVTNDIGCGSNGAYVGPQIRMKPKLVCAGIPKLGILTGTNSEICCS